MHPLLNKLKRATYAFLLPRAFRFDPEELREFYRTQRAKGVTRNFAVAHTAELFNCAEDTVRRIAVFTKAQEKEWTSLAHSMRSGNSGHA